MGTSFVLRQSLLMADHERGDLLKERKKNFCGLNLIGILVFSLPEKCPIPSLVGQPTTISESCIEPYELKPKPNQPLANLINNVGFFFKFY